MTCTHEDTYSIGGGYLGPTGYGCEYCEAEFLPGSEMFERLLDAEVDRAEVRAERIRNGG